DGIRDDLVTGVQTCALPISGNYTINVTVENAIGSVTATPVNITLAQPVCASSPTNSTTGINFSGAISGCVDKFTVCNVGETVTFSVQPFGWSKSDCDKYDWDFGDNSAHGTDATPTHSYSTAGPFPVVLKV